MSQTERPKPSADPPTWPSWAVGSGIPFVLAPCLGHRGCSRTLGTWVTSRRKCAVPFSDTSGE